MCRNDGCDRHELWGGLCLTHLRESLEPKPKRRRSTKKQVDAETLEIREENKEEDK